MDTTYAAKVVALSSIFAAAGYYACSSQNPVPILLTLPATTSAPFFSSMYYRGAAAVAPATILASTAFAYLAYAAVDPSKRRVYGAGAVLSIASMPWTAFVMIGGINRLLEISKDSALQVRAEQSGEVGKLLRTWQAQNYVRAGFSLAAGVVGLSAML